MTFLNALANKAITSTFNRDAKYTYHYGKRVLNGGKRRLKAYLKIDDPYSHLMVQALPDLIRRFDIEVDLDIVHVLNSGYYPSISRWMSWANEDCHHMAELYQMDFPRHLPPHNLSDIEHYIFQLIELAGSSCVDWERVEKLFWRFRAGKPCRYELPVSSSELGRSERAWRDRNFYQTGIVEFEGQIYPFDRLDHLEHRLNRQGAYSGIPWIKYDRHLFHAHKIKQDVRGEPFTLYFSFDCPYSYIALELAVRYAAIRGVKLILRPIKSMAQCGVKIPKAKQRYSLQDAASQARKHGMKFGWVVDPLLGVSNLQDCWQWAVQEGRELDFALAAMRGTWTAGLRWDRPKHLKRLCHTVGLDPNGIKRSVNHTEREAMLSGNMAQLEDFNLWAAPVLFYKHYAMWGQDRFGLLHWKTW